MRAAGGWTARATREGAGGREADLRRLGALALRVLVQRSPGLSDLRAFGIMRLLGGMQHLQLAIGAQLRRAQLGLQPLRRAEHGADRPNLSWWVGGRRRRCATSSSICHMLLGGANRLLADDEL